MVVDTFRDVERSPLTLSTFGSKSAARYSASVGVDILVRRSLIDALRSLVDGEKVS